MNISNLQSALHYSYYQKGRNRRHNNRKLTSGRKRYRMLTGGDGGYVPNNVVRAYKQAEAWERSIEIFKSKPAQYQLENAHKLIFMEQKLEQVYDKFNLEQYES